MYRILVIHAGCTKKFKSLTDSFSSRYPTPRPTYTDNMKSYSVLDIVIQLFAKRIVRKCAIKMINIDLIVKLPNLAINYSIFNFRYTNELKLIDFRIKKLVPMSNDWLIFLNRYPSQKGFILRVILSFTKFWIDYFVCTYSMTEQFCIFEPL